jgi:pimeloyl-[acyl-carrier protein] methyl ester esterase
MDGGTATLKYGTEGSRIESAAQPAVILLPGLDGTGDLFAPLLAVLPRDVTAKVISYPPDQALSYEALLGVIEHQLPLNGEMILLAESFSGPLALRYAAMYPQRVRAVVLCASFIRSPLPRWLRGLVAPLLFRLPLPAFAVRLLLVGHEPPAALVQSVKETIAKVRPAVLAHRLKAVFDLDCTDALTRCPAPILYLRAIEDDLVPPSALRAIQAIRRVEACSIRGPHLLLQAEPGACWREIEAFLVRQRIRQ